MEVPSLSLKSSCDRGSLKQVASGIRDACWPRQTLAPTHSFLATVISPTPTSQMVLYFFLSTEKRQLRLWSLKPHIWLKYSSVRMEGEVAMTTRKPSRWCDHWKVLKKCILYMLELQKEMPRLLLMLGWLVFAIITYGNLDVPTRQRGVWQLCFLSRNLDRRIFEWQKDTIGGKAPI